MTGTRNKTDEPTLTQIWELITEIRNDLKGVLKRQESDRKYTSENFKRVDSRITDLEREVNKKSVIITGIKKSEDDLSSLVVKITETVGNPLMPSDFDDLFRIGREKDIIKVTFLRYADKLATIKKVKETKLTTLQLGLKYNGKIYMNDALGPETSKTWKRARDLKKTKSIHNCFVAAGKVFIVQKEGDRPLYCRGLDDLLVGCKDLMDTSESEASESENIEAKKRKR